MWKFNWKECADCLLKRIWEILAILSGNAGLLWWMPGKLLPTSAAAALLTFIDAKATERNKRNVFLLFWPKWHERCVGMWQIGIDNSMCSLLVRSFEYFSIQALYGKPLLQMTFHCCSTRQRSEGVLFVGMHALRIHWILWTELGFSLYRNRHWHLYIAQNVASLLFTGWHQDPVARWSQFLFNV